MIARAVLAALACVGSQASAGTDEVTELPPLVVAATRVPQAADTVPLAVDLIDADALTRHPGQPLDETLRSSAAFSLFRRSSSLTANPTAQGVSLRGIGPSGAGRALVLLDGVPVNDPFGGWVVWSKLPIESLERVEIVRGGGSAAWGPAALGGVIHLVSRPPAATPTGRVNATLGDYSTRAITLHADLPSGTTSDRFAVDAAAFATDGVHLVRDPGAIDTAADSRHARAGLRWSRIVSPIATVSADLRLWEEERGNGTPYQRNESRESRLVLALDGQPTAGPIWRVAAHAQRNDYASTFSALSANRATETPANDQYEVPATSGGLSAQTTWGDPADLAEGHGTVTTLGVDGRHTVGKTREAYFYNGSRFTRDRRAGGAQSFAGVFAQHSRALATDLSLHSGARYDVTRQSDGFLRETIDATGVRLRDDTYATRAEDAFSPSLGLSWRPADGWVLRGAAYGAYRLPTLNELYRPFRIGTITTEANPGLRPETLRGVEAGLERTAADGLARLRATLFQNDLHDAVGNVTVNATTRRRENLDHVRVRGLELGGSWRPTRTVELEADYLLSDARVLDGGVFAPALDGRRLAQTPRHTVALGAHWQASSRLAMDARWRWLDVQFEDDLNTLPLAAATRLDVAVHYVPALNWRLTVAVDNVTDATIETGRTSAGVVSIAPPRWARVEISRAW